MFLLENISNSRLATQMQNKLMIFVPNLSTCFAIKKCC